MSVGCKLSILMLAATFLATAAIAEEMAEEYAVNIATNETLGKYLVNETGFTLYIFAEDANGNGTSTCNGDCAKVWLPFYVENLTVAEGLNVDDFTTVERTDGSEQIAYQGWPLYLWHKDVKAGDTLGQGAGNLWYVINPEDFSP